MTMLTRACLRALLAGSLLALTSHAMADAVDDIKARGTLLVGGKTDYKPFGYREPSGKIVGFSVDLAQRVADKLGVKLEIVPTTAANQLQFLEQGKVDIIIAAMNDTPERRKVVYIVEPGYYASGASVLAPKSANIHKWEDLKGLKVCAAQGAYFNREVQERYGADIIAFKAPTEAYNALRNGNCSAFVYDDNTLTLKLEDPEWASYEVPLKSIMPQPVAMAVRLGEERFHALLTSLSTEWYKTGVIAQLEDKWFPGKKSTFVQEMIAKYR